MTSGQTQPGGERPSLPRLDGVKLLFLVTEDWYFCSHRLPIARAARDAGAEVIVATRADRHGDVIEREGFRLVALPWRRRSTNLWRELKTLAGLVRLYRRERPDIVHHVAIKPAVYGGVAAMLGGRPPQVIAIAGFGYVSSSTQLRARIIRPILRWVFRSILNRREAHMIVQNRADEAAAESSRLFDTERVHVIRGSGVDVERFRPAPDPGGVVSAVLVARMLKSKGVVETVAASRLLRERGSDVRVVLVGTPDPDNPESIDNATLRAWNDEGVVEWRGHVDDVAAMWRDAHIALLPTTYHEGLPKTLLEAAACARPLIATDNPGCREVVMHEENGLVVPARDPGALADAIERLGADADMRRRMGESGRRIVEEDFAEEIVVRQTMALYTSMLAGRP